MKWAQGRRPFSIRLLPLCLVAVMVVVRLASLLIKPDDAMRASAENHQPEFGFRETPVVEFRETAEERSNESNQLLLFMMRASNQKQCETLRSRYVDGKCKLPCKHEQLHEQQQQQQQQQIATPSLRFRDEEEARNGYGSGFAGNQTAMQRVAQLRQCGLSHESLFCGFAVPSAFDSARRWTMAEGARCTIVTLTALFGRGDVLRTPRGVTDAESEPCHFAFVDRDALGALRRGRRAAVEHGARVGAWRLVVLDGPLPYGTPRRNSRVPKLLAHRFFPSASFCLWVDAKLELRITPAEAVRRFLAAPTAELAAVRNLRRDTIAHEHAWVTSWLCPRGGRQPRDEACEAVERQWEAYEHEQAASQGWSTRTVVIEGALLVLDLRSAALLCLLCNWHQEYARFGERDQLSFSYVLHVQRLPPRVHLISRRLHWSVAVQSDTLRCYNATTDSAQQLAQRFQHGRAAAPHVRSLGSSPRKPFA